MLKSILLDYIDVDISFIYETQLKIELSAGLKCQYHYHILSCQHLNWKWWLCKQKYPLQKCSGAFSIRQNNARCVRSHTPVSKKAFVKPGQLTLVSGHSQRSWSAGSCSPFQQDGSALASYQFFQESPPASWISVTVSVLNRSWADGYWGQAGACEVTNLCWGPFQFLAWKLWLYPMRRVSVASLSSSTHYQCLIF